MKTKIYLATDHAGFDYKNIVRDLLEREYKDQYEVIDCGAYKLDPADDYPDFISKAAKGVAKNPTVDKAIIFGGSGQGEAMVANKYHDVRATVYYGFPFDILALSKEHNNANVLSIGARFVEESQLEEVVRIWLQHDFLSDNERHVRRIKKMNKITQKSFLQRLFA